MKPLVVITHRIPTPGLEALFERCEVAYPDQICFSPAELMRLAPRARAILAGGPISAELIAAAPQLAIISNYGAGYDRVDVAAATRAGVPVTNIPDATSLATAELTLSLMLCLNRRVAELDRRMRAEGPDTLFGMGRNMGHSLMGRTLGIVGMGHIGRRVAELASLLGMRVIYHNRRPVDGCPYGYRSLEALLEQSDILSLHCPLTDQTRGLIGAAALARMRPAAQIVNTSRGAVIDTQALARALREGRLAGAALDVFSAEPEVPDCLKTLPNVLLTPHIGTNTHEARALMARHAADRILAALDGRRPDNVVNPEIYL